jgi:hypothetical protein
MFVGPYLNEYDERRTYIDETGKERRYHYAEYREDVWIDRGAYSYPKTSRLFGVMPNSQPIYEKYAEVKIDTLQDWVNFPFKADITVSSEPLLNNSLDYEPATAAEPLDIISHFNEQQRQLKKLIRYLLESSTKGDVMDKLEYLRQVEDMIDHQVLSTVNHDQATDSSDDATEGQALATAETTVRKDMPTANEDDDQSEDFYYIQNWRGLIFYELQRAVLERAKVNICQFCHKPIFLKPTDKPYRDYHKKSENQDCFMAKDRADQKEHRLFKKKK